VPSEDPTLPTVVPSVDAPGSSFMNDYETPAGPHGVFLKNLELVGTGTGAAITAEGRRVVERGVSIAMPNGGDVEGATLEGRERPGFVGDLLALQGDVPAPAEAIGASGGDRRGGRGHRAPCRRTRRGRAGGAAELSAQVRTEARNQYRIGKAHAKNKWPSGMKPRIPRAPAVAPPMILV